MPYCPFCRNHHRSRRGEHIIPKWMSLEFPESTWAIEDTVTGYKRKSTKYIHLTTPIPCTKCNTGWMSDLERVAAPVLRPLIHGIPTTLGIRDQIIMTKWFFKTAMVYDLKVAGADRPKYFEDDEFVAFAQTLAQMPSYMFFVAEYQGTQRWMIQEDHSAFIVAHATDLQPLGDPVRVYALTLVIKHLVLQICCAKTPPAVGQFYIKDFRPLCTQIAVSADDVLWPPQYSLGDTLIDEFVNRWSAVPPTRADL